MKLITYVKLLTATILSFFYLSAWADTVAHTAVPPTPAPATPAPNEPAITTVTPPAPPTVTTSIPGPNDQETAAQQVASVSDSDITTNVQARLLADSSLTGSKLNVTTKNGVVTLSGDATTQAQVDRAIKIASGVIGVKSIQSTIVVKTNAP